MNTESKKFQNTLQALQDVFLSQYPKGFDDPQLQQISKKHNVGKLVDFTQEAFKKSAFNNAESVCENMIRVVSRSSMVSMFEKPKFRDFVRQLTAEDKIFLSESLRLMLHGNQAAGFSRLKDILGSGKIAKWPLMTVFSAYYKPDFDVFVKPTTTKNILKHFSINELEYKPQPSWEFYSPYRELINHMKTKVDSSLSPNNAAFCGFLMMAMDNSKV